MTTKVTLKTSSGVLPVCLWSQAGVIPSKSCALDFECAHCRLDWKLRQQADENKSLKERGLIPKGKRGQVVFWKDRLKELRSWKRPCLHHMKGRIEFRNCTNDYSCNNCEFNQYFQDQYSVHAVLKPVEVMRISGFKIPHGYYLHRGHTWVKIEEDKSVRIGIDEFALKLLGPLDHIEAPLIGKIIEQNKAGISVSRGSHQADFLSPISGIVTDVNLKLREKGSIANKNPYTEGWVVRIHTDQLRRELKALMIGQEAKDSLEQEVNRLYRTIEHLEGPLAADGGELTDDIFGSLSQPHWDMLVRNFLT